MRQIKDLKCELRKYEMEIESLADQKHHETFTFLNNLPNKSQEKSEIISEQKEAMISFRNSYFLKIFCDI